jgi:hypothetical protein
MCQESQQEGSAVLHQLFCGSGAPVGVFHVEENTGFFKPPERVFPSGGNAGTMPVALKPIYMPVALYLLRLQAAALLIYVLCVIEFVLILL